MQPKRLAFEIGKKHDAVKRALLRSEGVHAVRVERGWYRARATPKLLRQIGIEPLQVHAIQAHISGLRLSPNGGGPFYSEGWGNRQNGPVFLEGCEAKGDRWQGDFRGRLVTFQRAEDGAFVSVRASSQPFTVGEFLELAAWLEGLAGVGGVVRLKGVDLNLDAEDHRVRLAGVESVSIGRFREWLLKMYNKEQQKALRLETCLHRLDLSFGEAARLLGEIAGGGLSGSGEAVPVPDRWGDSLEVIGG